MTDSSLTAERLIELIETGPALSSVVRAEVLAVLRSLDARREMSTTEGDIEVLKSIYQRRAARTPDDVFGVRELIDVLTSMNGGRYRALSLPESGKIIDIWLSSDLSTVIGCVVAPDRRQPSPTIR